MIKTKLSPEEKELKIKEKYLKEKQEELTEQELLLVTLEGDLKSFEIEYFTKVSTKYAILDKLQASLDKLLLSKSPESKIFQKKAQESQAKADKSSRSQKKFSTISEVENKKFEPTLEIKTLYRELAKMLHPDLVLEKEEKERRHKLMQEINHAYWFGPLLIGLFYRRLNIHKKFNLFLS